MRVSGRAQILAVRFAALDTAHAAVLEELRRVDAELCALVAGDQAVTVLARMNSGVVVASVDVPARAVPDHVYISGPTVRAHEVAAVSSLRCTSRSQPGVFDRAWPATVHANLTMALNATGQPCEEDSDDGDQL